jgi:hypothetical protein
MVEIDKKTIEELKHIVGHDGRVETFKRDVALIKDQRGQYTIRIPKRFGELAKLDPTKHLFTFQLLPKGEPPNTQYHITAELKYA